MNEWYNRRITGRNGSNSWAQRNGSDKGKSAAGGGREHGRGADTDLASKVEQRPSPQNSVTAATGRDQGAHAGRLLRGAGIQMVLGGAAALVGAPSHAATHGLTSFHNAAPVVWKPTPSC